MASTFEFVLTFCRVCLSIRLLYSTRISTPKNFSWDGFLSLSNLVCLYLFQTIREAKRSTPSIVYLPHIADWWDIIGDSVRSTLLSLLQDLDASLPLLLIATSETPSINLPSEVKISKLFYHRFA